MTNQKRRDTRKYGPATPFYTLETRCPILRVIRDLVPKHRAR